MISVGFVDNIVYDFHHKRLTPVWEIELLDKKDFKQIK